MNKQLPELPKEYEWLEVSPNTHITGYMSKLSYPYYSDTGRIVYAPGFDDSLMVSTLKFFLALAFVRWTVPYLEIFVEWLK